MTKTWKTRDGTVMNIKDMKDRHLVQALNMCLRQLVRLARRDALSMLCYAGSAPDGASMAAEQGSDELFAAMNDAVGLLHNYPEAKAAQALYTEVKKRHLDYPDEQKPWQFVPPLS